MGPNGLLISISSICINQSNLMNPVVEYKFHHSWDFSSFSEGPNNTNIARYSTMYKVVHNFEIVSFFLIGCSYPVSTVY